ncbi:MAG: hypothetical protein ACRC92_13765 [Peptostreptococcaceae bacterium]
MNINSAQGDSIEILLRQLGASKVVKVRGFLYFISFKINDDIEVSYSYNINSKNKYFLQRLKPYPLPQGKFADEYKIVEFIKKDLYKFKNAQNSSNFDSFVDISNKSNSITTAIENLFLNYNIEKDDLKTINSQLENILTSINKAKDNAKKL